MSIVERAVSWRSDGMKPRKSHATVDKTSLRAAKPSGNRPGRDVISIGAVTDRGMLSVTDNADLAKAFRFLKRPVLARVFGRSKSESSSGNVVMVASDMPGAGKSFISLNLAISIAQEQMIKVVLIDGDPIRRNLTRVLAQDERLGLMNYLADNELDLKSIILETDMPGLQFLPSGQAPGASTELIGSTRMSDLLDSLYDPDTVVLLDSPPILVTSEARILADLVHHTLIIVEAGRSTMSNVESVLKVVGEADCSTSFILNKSLYPDDAAGRVYYYDYGY